MNDRRLIGLGIASFVVTIGSISCASPAPATGAAWPAHRAALEDSLRSFMDRVLAAEDGLNAAAAADLSDDQEPALTVVGHDELSMTRDSLQRSLEAGWAAIDSSRQVFERIRTRAFSPEVANIVAHGRSRIYLKGGSMLRQRSTGTFILIRRPSGWRIAQSHLTVVPDTLSLDPPPGRPRPD